MVGYDFRMSQVVFKVPDFTDEDGITYSDIEVVFTSDGDVRETAALAGSVERSLDTSRPTAKRPKRPAKQDPTS
jgi:hypothetical protein